MSVRCRALQVVTNPDASPTRVSGLPLLVRRCRLAQSGSECGGCLHAAVAGYGTHDGQGNVPTRAPFEKGTGYDSRGQVATSFGKWPVAFDPVSTSKLPPGR